MKKTEIIFGIITALLFLIIIASAILLRDQKSVTTSTPPIPIFTPSAKPVISPAVIPPQLQEEKSKQENYAKAREELINLKPWLTRLPLKADNYFVSYNPDSDTIVVELYYYLINANLNKDQQLAKAKTDAITAIVSIGVNPEIQKIEYQELLKR